MFINLIDKLISWRYLDNDSALILFSTQNTLSSTNIVGQHLFEYVNLSILYKVSLSFFGWCEV